MDFQAIVMSSTEELQQLGCVRGDAMNVKHFAQTKFQEMKQVSAKDKKKRLLEEVLSQGAKDRVKPPTKIRKSRKKTVRKVNLGWLHFNESSQTYVQVKTQKGGGVRVVDLHVLSAKDVIINTGKDCFFPNGSGSFGPSDEMEFSISNFQQQEILNDDDFTLERYVEQFKLNRITLYLLSRRKNRSKSHSSLTLSSGSDSELEKPVFATRTTTHASESKVTTQYLDERRQLIPLQNEECLRSLEADREKQTRKGVKLAEEVEIVKKQEEMMLARKMRVPEVLCDLSEQLIQIAVHSSKLGQGKSYSCQNLRSCLQNDLTGHIF